MKVNIYIGFWTLTVKCTQCGLYGKVAFTNARANLFFKAGGAWASPGSEGAVPRAWLSLGYM